MSFESEKQGDVSGGGFVGDFTGLTGRALIAAGLPLAISDYPDAARQNAVIQAQLNARVQKTVTLGKGVWQASRLDIFPGTTLQGEGNKSVDGLTGTVIKLLQTDLSATYVMRAYPTSVEKRNITIKNLTIDISTSTTASGFLCVLDALATSDITFDNVCFIGTGSGAPAQLWIRDDTHLLYNCGITMINCRFIVATNSRGHQIDSSNNTTQIIAPKYLLSPGAVAGWFESSGDIQIDNYLIESSTATLANTTAANRSIVSKCNVSNALKNLTLTDATAGVFTQNDVGHPFTMGAFSSWITGVSYDGLSASTFAAAPGAQVNQTIAISRYSRNSGMPLAGYYFKGNKNPVMLNCGIDEACQWSVVFDATAGDSGAFPVTFRDCIIQAPVKAINGADVKLKIDGGTIISNLVNVDATSQMETYIGESAFFTVTNAYVNNLPTPKLEDQISAGGLHRFVDNSKNFSRPLIKVNVGQLTGSPLGGLTNSPNSGWINDSVNTSGAGSYLDGGAQNWDARAIPVTVPSNALNTFQYGATVEQTVYGLVPNATYDVTLFSGWNGSTFDATIKLNGTYIDSIKIGTANNVPAYRFVCKKVRGVANSSGNLVIRLDTISGNALMNGYFVQRSPDVTALDKIYRAEITQAGGAAPVANVIENTFDGPIVWARTGAGVYTGTLTGAFKQGRFYTTDVTTTVATKGYIVRTSENVITLTTLLDGQLVVDRSFIEIIVKA